MTAPVLDPRRAASASASASGPVPGAQAPPPLRRRGEEPAAAPARPDLRVLRPGADRKARKESATEADKAKLVRLLVIVGVSAVALCVFAIVVFHVVLTQNQFRLDAMQDQALEHQAEYDRLRLQVAQLESPDRIVADAQQRLGLVAAPKITYLAPTIEDTPGASAAVPRDPAEAAAANTDWSVVKPHLADG